MFLVAGCDSGQVFGGNCWIVCRKKRWNCNANDVTHRKLIGLMNILILGYSAALSLQTLIVYNVMNGIPMQGINEARIVYFPVQYMGGTQDLKIR